MDDSTRKGSTARQLAVQHNPADIPGPSRLVREVVGAISTDDEQPRSREPKHEGHHVYQVQPSNGNVVEEEVVQMEGGDFGGHQIIQGEDGEYYVVVDENEAVGDIPNMGPNSQEFGVVLERGSRSMYPGNNAPRNRQYSQSQDIMDDNQRASSSKNRMRRNEEEDDQEEMIILREHDQDVEGEELIDDDDDQEGIIIEPLPQGLKSRRNRKYGNCRCPECGASFINVARLERHLSVHQVFGSFLCPLCGKTYKYEYNLFHHWRKTCRDLNELIPPEERQNMEVNALRQLVDEVAVKKAEIGPIDIGISRSLLFQAGPLSRLEVPQNPLGRRGTACRACGVVISSSHMPRHLALHRGELQPDQRSPAGGFCCDLCGLVFRQHYNLIKHWRTGCPEIQANLPENIELTLDDGQLRNMVMDLLKRAVTVELDSLPGKKRDDFDANRPSREQLLRVDKAMGSMDQADSEQVIVDGDVYEEQDQDIGMTGVEQSIQETWNGVDQGVVYADDFGDEDDLMLVNEDGNVVLPNQVANKEKWKVGAGAGVQCPECFRSFANTGRLERHLAGFHASFGSHHCVLCGNRFKYDYNLLYHYRRSCPYTKAFIDRDVREQMDAQSLRKLVRQLAQKEVRLAPQMKPETIRLMNMRKGPTHNDVRARKEMHKLPGIHQQPPPELLQPKAGLPNAKGCPLCGVIFYGDTALDRHVQAAHGLLDANEARALQEQQEQIRQSEVSADNQQQSANQEGAVIEEEEGEIEPPPQLERQEPVDEPPEPAPPSEGSSRMRFVDELNEPVSGLNGSDMEGIQQMVEEGNMAEGDQIVIVENGVEVAFQVSSLNLSMRPPTIVLVRSANDPDTEYQEIDHHHKSSISEVVVASSANMEMRDMNEVEEAGLEDFGGNLLEEPSGEAGSQKERPPANPECMKREPAEDCPDPENNDDLVAPPPRKSARLSQGR